MMYHFIFFGTTVADAAVDTMGKWSYAGEAGVSCIHTIQLPDYRLLCWERPHGGYGVDYPPNPNTNGALITEIQLKNTVNDDGTWKSKFTPIALDDNAFCGGHSQRVDGSILIVGGDSSAWPQPDKTNKVVDGHLFIRTYRPCSDKNCEIGSWEFVNQMTTPRWYPSVITLHDGSEMIVGGVTTWIDINGPNNNNPTYEYFPPKTNGAWPRHLDILAWAYPFCLYPLLLQMPDGNVMMTVSNKSITIDIKTDQILYDIPDLIAPDHAPWIYPYTPTFTVLPMTIKNNYTFTVQACGGSSAQKVDPVPASNQCWQISPNKPNPKWVRVDNMPHGRVMVDSVILPDPILDPDLFDPEKPAGSQWKTLSKSSIPRLYHSEAILVQSGHVIVTGSEMMNYDDYWVKKDPNCYPNALKACTSPYNYVIERFSPSYLELANVYPRIVIKSAPSELSYNQEFEIEIEGDINSVRRVTFTRYSTVTHSTNFDQRLIELRILRLNGNKVVVRSPWSRAMAVPGNWMIWVLDDRDIPSESATILMKLDGTGDDFSLMDPNPIIDDFYKPPTNAAKESRATNLFSILLWLAGFLL